MAEPKEIELYGEWRGEKKKYSFKRSKGKNTIKEYK